MFSRRFDRGDHFGEATRRDEVVAGLRISVRRWQIGAKKYVNGRTGAPGRPKIMANRPGFRPPRRRIWGGESCDVWSSWRAQAPTGRGNSGRRRGVQGGTWESGGAVRRARRVSLEDTR